METPGLHLQHELSEFFPAFSDAFEAEADQKHTPELVEPEELCALGRVGAGKWWPAERPSRPLSADFVRAAIGRLIAGNSSRNKRVLEFGRGDREWIADNARLLRTAVREVLQSRRSVWEQPYVKEQGASSVVSRPQAVAAGFLMAAGFHFDAESLQAYLRGWQSQQTLEMGEIWALKPMLQLCILETIASAAEPGTNQNAGSAFQTQMHPDIPIPRLIATLRHIGEADWKLLFEDLSVVDRILRRDPTEIYARMDYESRDLYRTIIADLAERSPLDETEIAEMAVSLAEGASRHETADPRVFDRERHVGYYLIDRGLPHLRRRVGYRPQVTHRVRDLLRAYPNSFYLIGIEICTFLIVTLVLGGVPRFAPIVASFFFLFIPASQAAVELMNAIVVSLLPARKLPKLDFSEGIPDDFKTMVAVPTLLLSESQVQDLVHNLEVHYLANRDRSLYFALLTDGPDSDQPCDEKETLAEHASQLIRGLNHKYRSGDAGPFFLFHRHRVFNPSENVWMGWERKRGKLLDLNQLLRGAEDHFPVKVGDLSVLPSVQFVITLDSDTQLPRDTARRLVGTMAHPLNRAVVDPITNTVTTGYGILQPRVGISVHSASRSRLAAIYSGQTGFDIYTRAVSDVYQDLYGEGIFTGKGIYEVDVFRRVLQRRFPCNTLLSHDLIEGAYTRAALVSDIEVIDDYPSHFSAYSRRKHRWARGDWQIMQWLFPRVRDFHGDWGPNPTTVVSRWKIFDNLRRSLVDPALFFLLIAGWFFLPGPPWYWTLVAISLLLAPIYAQVLMQLLRPANLRHLKGALISATKTLAQGHLNVLLSLTFLAHQALVMIDAIVRTQVRHLITRRRLLQWETAAEAEAGTAKKTPVDVYLGWTPFIALGLTLALAFIRPEACPYAAPILLLWGSARTITRWLSERPMTARVGVKSQEEQFLRDTALRTWRYFRNNSGAAENWLVPDNVQESPPLTAHRISPTNLGLLLNARQAARAFGWISLSEFVTLTADTLSVARKLPRCRGHFFNWYDTRTLDPLEPLFISTVDSGNLAASLWALKQDCLSLLAEPILPESLWLGIQDHIRILRELAPDQTHGLRRLVKAYGTDPVKWLAGSREVETEAQALLSSAGEDVRWWAAELVNRLAAAREQAETFAPWLSAVMSAIQKPAVSSAVGDLHRCLAGLTLQRLPMLVEQIRSRLQPEDLETLSEPLSQAAMTAEKLQLELRRLATEATRVAEEMDFRFLYNRRRKLLAVGYDIMARRLHPACYDLLASEARTAFFVAIAKGDIPQESWFHLGRTQTQYKGRRILLSWTGTMFEYLMPGLWMKTYPHTILEQSMRAAVEAQQLHCRGKRIPWGISESAHPETDDNGSYQYSAFGLPRLALKRTSTSRCVIAPYATFLALEVYPAAAVRNLRHMWKQQWLGEYGFYDAIGFEKVAGSRQDLPVKTWMVHHQAMSLMSVANRLLASPFQRWFHAEPQVIATELLLHEKVPAGLKIETEPETEAAMAPAESATAAA